MSIKNGFEKRSSGKINAVNLILAFIAMMQSGNKSYLAWSRSFAMVTGKTISKQGIFKKMNKSWLNLLKTLLQDVLKKQSQKGVRRSLLSPFKNVWVQDSTTLHLPDIMSSRFKGNVSRGKQKSVAKINIVINVLTGSCPVMELMGFTVNEQKLSGSILSIAKKGDLVIRDLGYFVLSVFTAMDTEGIYFLSRLKYNVGLYDIKTDKKLELARLLKGKPYLDRQLKCGAEEKLVVRLVALKLSPERAAERRRKAKQDRDWRANHSEDYYILLDYLIFITNVEPAKWNYKQVAQAYRSRWNIEILFKSWKSGFKMEEMIPDDKTHTERIESYIYMMLLYVAWFHQIILIPFKWIIEKKTQKQISILKTAAYMIANFSNWLCEGVGIKDWRQLTYFCCYEKRAKPNAIAGLELFYMKLG